MLYNISSLSMVFKFYKKLKDYIYFNLNFLLSLYLTLSLYMNINILLQYMDGINLSFVVLYTFSIIIGTLLNCGQL